MSITTEKNQTDKPNKRMKSIHHPDGLRIREGEGQLRLTQLKLKIERGGAPSFVLLQFHLLPVL